MNYDNKNETQTPKMRIKERINEVMVKKKKLDKEWSQMLTIKEKNEQINSMTNKGWTKKGKVKI